MPEQFQIAVTGDSTINRRVSICRDDSFLSIIDILRKADVSFTSLETMIHDYEGPEIYPAAEPGWTSMRSPLFVAEELKWAGFKIISLATNHTLDYSYGGLKSTWKALDETGLVHAGTGNNLGEARDPAYLDLPGGRIALISMCSTFTSWVRAGEARRDMKGRPGLNPLRFYYKVDSENIEIIKRLAIKLGWWVTKIDKDWLLNPAGLHNTIHRFVESREPGISTVADEQDVDGNLRSIRHASRQADYVIVHLHNHEWDPGMGISHPSKFVPPFARACIDAGAAVFVAQGSHSALRGLEVYKNKPIFYDPGDFFTMADTVTRLPSDVYLRTGFSDEVRKWEATPTDFFDGRAVLPEPINPPGGYGSKPFGNAETSCSNNASSDHETSPFGGSVVGVCTFNSGTHLLGIELYPFVRIGQPRSRVGIPIMVDSSKGQKIIEYLQKISSPFGTKITFRDGRGVVQL